MTPPLGAPFLGYATELARARLDALPFADYADADPGRLPLDEDDNGCGACNARPGEDCRDYCRGRSCPCGASIGHHLHGCIYGGAS